MDSDAESVNSVTSRDITNWQEQNNANPGSNFNPYENVNQYEKFFKNRPTAVTSPPIVKKDPKFTWRAMQTALKNRSISQIPLEE